MIIRPLASHDIASCVEIVRLNWSEETAIRARQELSTAYHVPQLEHHHWVAFDKGSLIAFAGMIRSRKTPAAWEFTFLAAHPHYHGFGAGGELTRHRLAEVEKRSGSAVEVTTRIPQWFRRFGFKQAFKYEGGMVGMVKQFKPVMM